jgi:hypothetical protein
MNIIFNRACELDEVNRACELDEVNYMGSPAEQHDFPFHGTSCPASGGRLSDL